MGVVDLASNSVATQAHLQLSLHVASTAIALQVKSSEDAIPKHELDAGVVLAALADAAQAHLESAPHVAPSDFGEQCVSSLATFPKHELL